MIYITSDWHFCHNKPFIYEARGYKTVDEMNEAIINKHNAIVKPDDDVYVLGDLMLNDNDKGIECIKQLNGNLHILNGNHDTKARIELYYTKLPNFTKYHNWATVLKYKKYTFYLSHFPTITSNYDDKGLSKTIINLFGHIHSKEPFYENNPFMYNVAMDAHDCAPVGIEEIIEAIQKKMNME